MVTRYPYDNLGQADHGWLRARHHFSFAHYDNPGRHAFGPLRVINDDIIAPGTGFGAHPHANMEIITYVRQGAITHKDSIGNQGRTEAGSVQVMSAGKGVFHSEFNLESQDTKLFQIWIEPNRFGVSPRWDSKEFPKHAIDHGPLPLLVSGRHDDADKGALHIYQDAAIYGGRIKQGALIEQQITGPAYVLASSGCFSVNGERLDAGDGAEITDCATLTFVAETDAEILVIDLPGFSPHAVN